jgi:predicted ATPase
VIGREDAVLSFGPFALYPRTRRLERKGRPVRIGDRALDILLLLADRAGEIVTKEELMARVWCGVSVEDSAVRVHIAGVRRALGDPADRPRFVKNVSGRGYSFVGIVSRATSPERSEARFPSGHTRASQLPSRLDRMVGRDEALRELSTLVFEKRFVSVVGPGGIGKTTLAIAAAHTLRSELAGDAFFIDLSWVTDPEHVLVSVAAGLGFPLNGDQAQEGLAAFLRDRSALIVLDSCEHIVDAIAPLVERVFREAPGVYILATSREGLRAEGEWVYRISPLETPPASERLSAREIMGFSAIELFVERATANGTRLTLSDADAAIVAEICRRLDGIALAIEFAAGRVETHGLRGTASLLENRLRLVWQGRRTALPRHQTLNALLDWSYNLLGEVEQALLRRLSLFVGPFSLEAVAAMKSDLDPGAAIDALGGLVDKSLVAVVDVRERGALYRLLDATRAHARAKLDASGERPAVAARQATYLCKLLEDENRTGSGIREHTLAEQIGSIRAALEWAFSDTGDVRIGVRLATASAPVFMELSLLAEYSRWAELALSSLDPIEQGTHRELSLQAAIGTATMFSRANSADARAALQRSIELAGTLKEPYEQLRLLGTLHMLHVRRCEWVDSLSVARHAERVAETVPSDTEARLFAAWMVEASRNPLGHHLETERVCSPALNHVAASASKEMLRFGSGLRVRALLVLARARWFLGRADDALVAGHATVRAAEEQGQPTSIGLALVYTFYVLFWRGDLDGAATLVKRTLEYTRRYSLGPYVTVAQAQRGMLLVKSGDAAGIDVLRRSIERLRQDQHLVLNATLFAALAEGLANEGLFAEALAAIDAALAETERNQGQSWDMPEMLRIKGHILAARPDADRDEAERYLVAALDCARQQSALAWELRVAMTTARFWSNHGRKRQARDLVATTYKSFSQGFGTSDMIEARQLLSDLRKTTGPK